MLQRVLLSLARLARWLRLPALGRALMGHRSTRWLRGVWGETRAAGAAFAASANPSFRPEAADAPPGRRPAAT
jgi:hypothetical protein